jgi:filamentous hemagglutinin
MGFERWVARVASTGIASAVVLASGQTVELPRPCTLGACGPGVPGFVTQGNANATAVGNTLNVAQQSNTAVLNWQSFNLSRDGTVNFQQPDAAALAINRIFQNDASRIAGALNSNGRVYLLNQNGILFAEGARLNVGGLLASSLDLTPQAIEGGLGCAAAAGAPALQGDAQRGAVRVDAGARISSPQGQVLLFAPEVTNRGEIATPGGQTILGAGQRVFLAASSDPNLRGLLVEVGAGGVVTNGEAQNATRSAAELVGRISADAGNVTLAGMTVRQQGAITANTTVRSGGSVRLQARERVAPNATAVGTNPFPAERTGTLQVGANSLTAIDIDTRSDETTVDANEQPRSRVDMFGQRIEVAGGAQILAPGGDVTLSASVAGLPQLDSFSATPDAARILIAPGARIDVSGASLDLPVERNSLRVELRGNQLADS